MTRRCSLVLVAVVALAAGSCGLPDDQQPRVITAADAPLDLNQVPGAAVEPTEGNDEVELYFVREEELQPVMRTAADNDLTTAVQLLLDGPTAAEANFNTSIPSETELNAAELDGTTAVLDLGCVAEATSEQCGILGVAGQQQFTAFAQLVCTATNLRGIEGVRFLQEGEPQDAPTDGGTIQSPTPVSCDDYRSLQS